MENRKRIIKALSLKRIEEGSIGFLTTAANEESAWYNVAGEPEVLKELIKNVIAKGNTIEFEFNNGVVGSLKLIEKAPEESRGTDDLTTFEELLASAHEKFEGEFTIKTELISHDKIDKSAVFKAIVIVPVGEITNEYQAHGDADQGNCGNMVKIHYLRMAETRAISRALRWATNNAKAAIEETEHGDKE